MLVIGPTTPSLAQLQTRNYRFYNSLLRAGVIIYGIKKLKIKVVFHEKLIFLSAFQYRRCKFDTHAIEFNDH